MTRHTHGRTLRWGAMFAALALVVACSDTGPTASVDDALLTTAFAHTGANSQIGTPTVADLELVEVCKRWVGARAVANFEVGDGTHTHTFTDAAFLGPYSAMGYDDWYCADVWLESPPNIVTVTETSVTGGAYPYTTSVTADGLNTTPVIVGTSVTGTVQGAGGPKGFVAFYTNTEVIPPPGDEGCTPGYWKNHLEDWVGYDPYDSYDAVFGVASTFGGTLLEALERGGGKEMALGRHATAALLNAASGGVNAYYTGAEVIAMVQDAYAYGNFNYYKNMLEAANELGCPL